MKQIEILEIAKEIQVELGSLYSIEEITDWLITEGIESGDPLELLQYYLDSLANNLDAV